MKTQAPIWTAKEALGSFEAICECTRPIENHPDPRSIADCQNTVREFIQQTASAPDLLEALQTVLEDAHVEECDSCEGTGKRHNSDDACHRCGGCGEIVRYQIWPDFLRQARAAIARATGEQK